MVHFCLPWRRGGGVLIVVVVKKKKYALLPLLECALLVVVVVRVAACYRDHLGRVQVAGVEYTRAATHSTAHRTRPPPVPVKCYEV